MSICGEPDGGPTKYGVAIVDVCTGMLSCSSILAALNARQRTGKGQKVELSLYETSLAMLINVASNYLTAGRNGGRFGNGHPSIVPYTTYRAADAMIAIGIGNERSLPAAPRCSAIRNGRRTSALPEPRAGREPRHRRPDQRGARARRRRAWLAKLMAVGIPCGKINSVAEALDDPHTAARDMIETVEHPASAREDARIPFKFSDTACSVRRRRRRSASTATRS